MENEQVLKAPKLLAKLHQIMSEIDFIAKDKQNSAQNYKYASEQAIKERLHPLLVKHSVLFVPLDQELIRVDPVSESKQRVTTVKMHYMFYDVESGESLPAAALGSGADSMDKGTFKAITGALKYVMTNTFLIPTGDDPEGDGGSGGERGKRPARASGEDGHATTTRKGDPNAVISEPQRKRMFALMHKGGKTPDQVKEILRKHGFEHSEQVTAGKYDAICQEIEAK